MHSRIFEVKKVEKEIPEIKADMLTESLLAECHNRFWDYVDDMNIQGVRQSFEWFSDCEGKLFETSENTPENRVFELTGDVRCRFFEKKYQMFKERAEKLTLEEFSGAKEGSVKLWELSDALDEKYGFYILTDYFGYPVTLDYFIRNAPDGKYALCWAMDYHF